MSNIPSVVDGPRLSVTKKIEYDLPCPKCNKPMRITGVKEGALVKCGNCDNVTWSMRYVPPWWAKTSRFLLSIIISFILGLSASLLASWIYEKYSQPRSGGFRTELPIPEKR